MNPQLERLLQEATRLTQLTRSGDLHAATAAIQASLAAHLPAGAFATVAPEDAVPAASAQAARASWSPGHRATANHEHAVIDVEARDISAGAASTASTPASAPAAPASSASASTASSGSQTAARPSQADAFVAGSYADSSTGRDFKLYIPPGAGGRPMPLVVMLHGCTQHPDDFAAGTAMNELARAQGFFVLYPAQSQKANPQRCWNWFKHSHQARGRGEPALLAGMTRDVMARYAIDADRVYIAGLSAGGAMAAIMGETYPELYAAVGVHSGLAAGVATDLPSAMAAMSGNQGTMGKGNGLPGQRQGRSTSASHMPTIVFHGDADGTVHHSNGEQVIAAAVGENAVTQSSTVTAAQGRRGSEQRTYRNIDGSVLAEHWRVKGAPHAWSGGRAQGSYTDPGGPDASVEMMRFFMAHPRRAN